MIACTNYTRHEFECIHKKTATSIFRWRTDDGCQGTVCHDCLMDFVVRWDDMIEAYEVDHNGVPLHGIEPRTEAEAVCQGVSGGLPDETGMGFGVIGGD